MRGVVDRLREAGWETFGEIVDFEDTFLLCYVRGPEGLIVELAGCRCHRFHSASTATSGRRRPVRGDASGSASDAGS